jgi:hypothetical protein
MGCVSDSGPRDLVGIIPVTLPMAILKHHITMNLTLYLSYLEKVGRIILVREKSYCLESSRTEHSWTWHFYL